jgi:hypothetical protein
MTFDRPRPGVRRTRQEADGHRQEQNESTHGHRSSVLDFDNTDETVS